MDKLRMLTKKEQMEPETTCKRDDTTEKGKLYMGLMSQKEWNLGFSVGPGQAPRLLSVSERDLGGLMAEIRLAAEWFRLGGGVFRLFAYFR
jgi:hypothetical protein